MYVLNNDTILLFFYWWFGLSNYYKKEEHFHVIYVVLRLLSFEIVGLRMVYVEAFDFVRTFLLGFFLPTFLFSQMRHNSVFSFCDHYLIFKIVLFNWGWGGHNGSKLPLKSIPTSSQLSFL